MIHHLALLHALPPTIALSSAHPITPVASSRTQPHMASLCLDSSPVLIYGVNIYRDPDVSIRRHVRLFAALWTVAHQAPLSMGFPGQEYWSGMPFPPPGNPPDPGRILHHWASREKQNSDQGFSGGSVMKIPPANAGNPWSGKVPHATEQLNLCTTAPTRSSIHARSS